MNIPANIRLNTSFPFPALVNGSGPVTLSKKNGIWTIGLSADVLAVQVPPPGSYPNDYVLVWDSVTKTWFKMPLSALSGGGGGIGGVITGQPGGGAWITNKEALKIITSGVDYDAGLLIEKVAANSAGIDIYCDDPTKGNALRIWVPEATDGSGLLNKTFTGSIAGTVLTASDGTLVAGMQLTDTTGLLARHSWITTGPSGAGPFTYTVTPTQTVASETMSAAKWACVTNVLPNGSWNTSAYLVVSGNSNFDDLPGHVRTKIPPTADPCMVAIWADVPKAIQMRGPIGSDSFPGGAAALSVLDGANCYTGSWDFYGTHYWGDPVTNTTFAGQDTLLGRGAAPATLQVGGPDTGAPVKQRFGVANVANVINDNTFFLAGNVLHFASIPGGVAVGQAVTSSNSGSIPPGVTVGSIDNVLHNVTLTSAWGGTVIPYPGETIFFNGVNGTVLVNMVNPTQMATGALKSGIVTGQVVGDVSNPAAIPGGTTLNTITQNVFFGFTILALSAVINSTTFNTAPGGHDIVSFSTVNGAAKDLELVAGLSTGTGAGGLLRLMAGEAGASGGVQNTASTYLTVDPVNKIVSLQRPIASQSYTVGGTLPAASAALAGARAHVTNSNATFTAGIGAIVAAGGANVVPVFCDGTNWRIG